MRERESETLHKSITRKEPFLTAEFLPNNTYFIFTLMTDYKDSPVIILDLLPTRYNNIYKDELQYFSTLDLRLL